MRWAVDGLFRVLCFFDALIAYFGEPLLKGFGLRGGDGLNDAQKLLNISDIGKIEFVV